MHIWRGYRGKTKGGVWQGWNFGPLQLSSFATKKSKIASLSVQWWSWSWSSWSWSWSWRSWSSSWSWWSWSSAKLRERLAHNADGRQFSGFSSENLREAQNNQIQPDNCQRKVSKTQDNQIQPDNCKTKVKLDLSKLCEFCIKSCAEWRKMTAVNWVN